MCLLGDSAHASTPHIGAGAAMAMEDEFLLSSLVGAIRDQMELEKAFRAFDAVRFGVRFLRPLSRVLTRVRMVWK